MRELSLHILDVLENAVAAGATCVELTVEEELEADLLRVTVRDNGRGMDKEEVTRVCDPFYTTRRTRHVGLGIPLFRAAADRCNGQFTVTSEVGRGTRLEATFQHSHIDRAPLGDIEGTLMAFMLSGGCDLRYIHRVDDETFQFDTVEIRSQLNPVPLTHPEVREWLQGFISEGEAGLAAGP